MKIVPDFIEVPLTAQDANCKVDFVVAFKLINPKQARYLRNKTLKAEYELQVALLLSNIVYIHKLADSSGNLVNSFEQDITKTILSSLPYFKTILVNWLSILYSMGQVNLKSLQEANLFECGKFQYEADYGIMDLETQIKEDTKKLQDSMGAFMSFTDEEIVVSTTVTKEKLTISSLPKLVWKSNVIYLELFNLAKFYQNEWAILNPIVLIELAKEFKLTLKDTLGFIPIIQAGYNSLKPEK